MSEDGVNRHERDVLRAGYDGVDCLGRGRSFHRMNVDFVKGTNGAVRRAQTRLTVNPI